MLKKSKSRPGCYVYLDEQDSQFYDKVKDSKKVADLYFKQLLEEKAVYCKENLRTYDAEEELNEDL